MWGGISSIATTAAAAVTEVTSVVQDDQSEVVEKVANHPSAMSDIEIADLKSQLDEKEKR